jgi:DNA sulfur modification protein DndD
MKFSISSIELTNFRQYIGTQEIDFRIDDTQNVAVICGANGAGKSNLLNALTWCLYGFEVHGPRHASDVVNWSIRQSLENNQSTYAEVKVHLKTDKGPWTVMRKLGGRKNEHGEFSEGESELTVIWPFEDQDKVVTGDGTRALINTLLPEALNGFFFIDGEQLHDFFRVSTPKKISAAIDDVSQLELVKNAVEHFSSLAAELHKQVKKTTPKLEDLQYKITYVGSDIKNRNNEIAKKERVLLDAESELITVKEFLKNNSVENVRSLERERQQLETDIQKDIQPRLRSLESDRNTYLVDIAPFIYLKKPIEDTYSLIDDKMAKGELPSRIKETFVRELIEKGRCICGNDLSTEGRATLEEFANLQTLSELSDVAFSGKTTISDILTRIEEFPSTIDKKSIDIDGLRSVILQKQLRIEEISKQVKECNIDQVKLFEDRRDQLVTTKARSIQTIEGLTSQVAAAEVKKQQYEKEYEKELRKEKENLALSEKLKLVTDSQKVLRDTIDITKTRIRKQVEKNTNANFQKLIRKKETFKRVVIDDEYAVSVMHAYGYNVLSELSAGENLVLGLSFMSALVSISGFQAPVIIDSPLVKLDDEHKDHVTRMLPEFLAGTQLILLVKPNEIDNQQVKDNIAQFLIPSNFYRLTENSACTEVEVKHAKTCLKAEAKQNG